MSACIRGPRIATEGLAAQQADQRRGRRRLRPWHCDICGDWHLTATAPTRRPR